MRKKFLIRISLGEKKNSILTCLIKRLTVNKYQIITISSDVLTMVVHF